MTTVSLSRRSNEFLKQDISGPTPKQDLSGPTPKLDFSASLPKQDFAAPKQDFSTVPKLDFSAPKQDFGGPNNLSTDLSSSSHNVVRIAIVVAVIIVIAILTYLILRAK